MKAVYETEVDGNSVVIWESSVGHRVIFPSDTFAFQQAKVLQDNERRFHQAKIGKGVHVIEAYGEEVTPYTYIRRCFQAWRSKAGQRIGITVLESCLTRDQKEAW